MKYILVNTAAWQNRIAIMRDGLLQNLYLESREGDQLERAYFKGVVAKVLPGIQTAFVDIGQERAGFLHISEIDRDLAIKRMSGGDEEIEEEVHLPHESGSKEVDISKIFKQNEQILVQVSKEPIHEKGAKLTTCFTLPGRFLVLMPNVPRIGISKKIDTQEERQRLRQILTAHLPAGMGAIIRTTCEHKDDHEIIQDLNYLVATWREIQRRFQTAKPEERIYSDINAAFQAVRDHLDSEVDMVICDDRTTQSELYSFVKEIAPELAHKIYYYNGEDGPLFSKYGIEKQIDQALEKKVPLASGGSIIIESTEAMTVIDVNTGRYLGATKLEETILKTNLEAAEEVVRQLRLRNIGGLIVIDFIDLSSGANRQKLFKFFEKTLRERDKFQSVVLKISEFGLVQMTRKRSGKTLIQQMTDTCAQCRGCGFIKSIATESYAILRDVQQRIAHSSSTCKEVIIHVHDRVFEYLIDKEYNALLALEKQYAKKITLVSQQGGLLGSYSYHEVC